MKPTDTLKYELLGKLCAAHDADPDGEPPCVTPVDVMPSYLERDDEASRKQAQWVFSAVQSLESQRIVRMTKSKHDGGTFVDTVTLEDPEKAAVELEKLEHRVAQEEAEQARAEEAVARKREQASHGQRHGRRRTSGPVDPRITEEAAEYLDEVDSPLTPRELSLLVTGDTKKLDKVGLKRVAQTLRRRGQTASRSNLGALEEAGVVADLKTICVKGPVVLITQKGAVDASILPNGISMFDADLANIDRAYVRAKRIITVENLDAYRRCNDDDVYIYTQGSVSPRHRAMLRMIHEQNPDVTFAHFGDIDYAGLKAHQVIEETLGCEVGLFHMGIAELANPAYRKAIHPLTSKDRDLLAQLLEFERYRGLVSYMLERNVKLEQEIVALDLFSDYDVDSAMAALPAGRGEKGTEAAPARQGGTYRKQSQRNRGPRRGQGQQAPAAPKAEEAAAPAGEEAAAAPEAAERPETERRRTPRRRTAARRAPKAAEAAAEEQPEPREETVEEPVVEEPEPAAATEPEAPETVSEEPVADVHPGRASRRRRTRAPRKAEEKAAAQQEPAEADAPVEPEPAVEGQEPAEEAPKPRRRRRTRKAKAAEETEKPAAEPEPEPAAAPEPAPEPAEKPAPRSKAAQTRQLRDELLENLKNGTVSPLDILEAVDDVARSITVVRFLSAVPGWDKKAATDFMNEAGISAGRTLRGLGKKQRTRVVEAVSKPR